MKEQRKRSLFLFSLVTTILVLSSCTCCGLFGFALVRSSDDHSSDEWYWTAAERREHIEGILTTRAPAACTDVHYQYHQSKSGAGFHWYTHHTGIFRCDLSEADFQELVTRLHMTRVNEDDYSEDVVITFEVGNAPWWRPPTTIDSSVYYVRAGESSRFARHDGQTMWFVNWVPPDNP